VFLLWYGGRGRPMTAGEVDSLVAKIQRNARAVGAVDVPSDLLASLREVARNDDGHEFVMLNLIKYRPKAVYPPGYSYGDDARAADVRYNRAVVPLLLKRACFPVFVGDSAGRFLASGGSAEWDCIALVRYRSRRDLLGLAADLAKNRADIHKWASIEKTQVFPVRVRFSVMVIRLIAAGMLIAAGVVTYVGLR
jgi:hypothetical protein